MKIIIPSHKRSGKMTTWKNLPEELQAITQVAVYAEEISDYRGYPLMVLPPGLRGIANKREYISKNAGSDKVLILDDDLTFAKRRTDEPTKVLPNDPIDTINMVAEVKSVLNQVAHGAIATREGGNRDTDEYKYNTRALRAHFFRTDVLFKEGVRVNEVQLMEDFHVTLRLLRLGYYNVILNKWVTNQHGSNTAGGCSETRTLATHAQAAHALKELHPEFVSVVKKKTKTAWGGEERTDVVIQWKKAFNSSMEKKHVKS